MKLDLTKIKQYRDFLEKMLEKSSGEKAEKFTKEETSLLAKLIPGFDFQIIDEDKRFKIITAIEAAEILLDKKMQKKLEKADSWNEVDRMAMRVMADRELEEYQNSVQRTASSKQEKGEESVQRTASSPDATVGVPTTAKSGSSEKWHQNK